MTTTLAQDPALAVVQPALDAAAMIPRLAEMLGQPLEIRQIRLLRHKLGRRCLIAYDLVLGDGEAITLLGKARSRRPDHASYQLQRQLWQQGFDDHSADGISVPQPLGMLPDLHLWFQRWVPGQVATQVLAEAGDVAPSQAIAAAIAKLHRAGIPPRKRHTLADELAILHQQLATVQANYPHWQDRLGRILDQCATLAARIPTGATTGIHRDFYPDQVIFWGDRRYLIDLDLYCEGDPALDIGNFVAHISEQSLRTLGRPDGLLAQETAFIEACCHLNAAVTPAAINAYKTLTLVRHIAISHRMASRQHLTASLMDWCEQRLGLG